MSKTSLSGRSVNWGSTYAKKQLQRPYELHETLEAPGIPVPIRGCEDQETVVDNFSTSHLVAATMLSLGTRGIDTTLTSSNIFNQAVNRYGHPYPVFEEDNSVGVEVDASDTAPTLNMTTMRKQKLCQP